MHYEKQYIIFDLLKIANNQIEQTFGNALGF